MLNKERLLKWIEELESDKYKQGTGSLKTVNNEFCCLGVLTNLAIGDGVGCMWTQDNTEIYPTKVSCKPLDGYDKKYTDFPPTCVYDWLGENANEILVDSGLFDQEVVDIDRDLTLAELNDSSKETFKQIAARLRKLL